MSESNEPGVLTELQLLRQNLDHECNRVEALQYKIHKLERDAGRYQMLRGIARQTIDRDNLGSESIWTVSFQTKSQQPDFGRAVDLLIDSYRIKVDLR